LEKQEIQVRAAAAVVVDLQLQRVEVHPARVAAAEETVAMAAAHRSLCYRGTQV